MLKITLPIYFNKTELGKENLNSDCQQFHQYQQKRTATSHFSPLSITNPGPGLRQVQKCGGVKLFNEILPFL